MMRITNAPTLTLTTSPDSITLHRNLHQTCQMNSFKLSDSIEAHSWYLAVTVYVDPADLQSGTDKLGS
ncbi:hypothetical protein CY34DRAFT_230161 [Suillus luteus UH-Slu-Lm8-n1]|uniref:Uncharacterized protein n=1 Tax=Suillus luteus UH-Slu-Lm8-n1 TaxID=930992 RepID=A0A0D0BP64_9AGAM|nr:hypothetical protein CY34DRAFT_230161 [Suillus luteus UH-Slu-Lm8-n1]